jgi:RNA polymerase sigma factor (sigma-70 family)
MTNINLKPKNRKQYLAKEYPHNLISTMIEESVFELNLPAELTERHLAGLAYAISFLEEREQTIIRMRYEERRTFSEIAKKFDISVNRATQVERAALRKLYNPQLLNYYKYGL